MVDEKFMKSGSISRKIYAFEKYAKSINIGCFASAFNIEGVLLLKKTKDTWIKYHHMKHIILI